MPRYSYNCVAFGSISTVVLLLLLFDYYEDFSILVEYFLLVSVACCNISYLLRMLQFYCSCCVVHSSLIHNNITCFESINYKFFAELARRFVFPSMNFATTPNRQHTSRMHDLPQFRCSGFVFKKKKIKRSKNTMNSINNNNNKIIQTL